MSNAPVVNDLVIMTEPEPPARVEYIERDVQVVSAYGARWQVPAEHFVLVAPADRGGTPARWAISPEWTD